MRKTAWVLNSYVKNMSFWDFYDLVSESPNLESAWKTYSKHRGESLPSEYLAIYLIAASLVLSYENNLRQLGIKKINQVVKSRVGGYGIYGVRRFTELADSRLKPLLKKELSPKEYKKFKEWLKMTEKA